MRSRILLIVLLLIGGLVSYAQEGSNMYIEKRYNIFFRINSSEIDPDFKGNARAIETMREDVQTTLSLNGAVPDSLLILSTSSPDGSYEFNKRLASNRAKSTERLLLEMFPQFKDAHIKVEYLEEDWDGLLQVLKAHPEFPQREEMMQVLLDDEDSQSKEIHLKKFKEGWDYLVKNYIYALRNSSITLSVAMTASNKDDEFVREQEQEPEPVLEELDYSYMPKLEQPHYGDILPVAQDPKKYKKTALAARTNLLMPGLTIGLEIPILDNWSIGIDYLYPWAVSKKNTWCAEVLALFVDAKYWFTGDKNRWLPDSKLKGHAVGLYAGTGYYDLQNKIKGAQGEFVDFGVDYTYALPVANDKLRLEFNLGIGFIKTWYRPYTPSTDFTDLIKEPGVKYRATNFIGPTKAGVSLVYPITVPVKKNPYLKMADRYQRKLARQTKRKGGAE